MPEPSTHNNYTFEDIQRYLQGKMSAAEMHEIEKAALQDPFLADAIEGYNEISSTIARQHLNEINAGLSAEKKESKVVAFNQKARWLSIAVMVIVLAGVSVIVSYIFKSSNKQQQVAQVKKEENKKPDTTQNSVATIIPETSSANETVVAQNSKQQKNIHPLKKEKSVEPDTEANIPGGEITTARATAPLQNDETSKSFAPLSNQKNNDTIQDNLQGEISSLATAANTFTGKVIDENNKPVSGAVIETDDKKEAVVTDLNGNFILQKNDSVLNVTAATVGYENKNALLKPNNINLITLKVNSSALNDVVVTGYSIKKSKAANQTATPVGGWQNFNHYVVTQLNKDSTNKKNYISNDDVVELEFLIDNSGSPYNIRVTKPLDEEKNSRAINILKSGPKWMNTSKNKKAKVAIAF